MDKIKRFFRKPKDPEKVALEESFLKPPAPAIAENEWVPYPVQVPNDLKLTKHFDRDKGIAWFEPAMSEFVDYSPLDWLRYRAAIARSFLGEDLKIDTGDFKIDIEESKSTTNGVRRKGEFSINGNGSYTEQEALFCIFAYADGARDMQYYLQKKAKESEHD